MLPLLSPTSTTSKHRSSFSRAAMIPAFHKKKPSKSSSSSRKTAKWSTRTTTPTKATALKNAKTRLIPSVAPSPGSTNISRASTDRCTPLFGEPRYLVQNCRLCKRIYFLLTFAFYSLYCPTVEETGNRRCRLHCHLGSHEPTAACYQLLSARHIPNSAIPLRNRNQKSKIAFTFHRQKPTMTYAQLPDDPFPHNMVVDCAGFSRHSCHRTRCLAIPRLAHLAHSRRCNHAAAD